MNSPNIKKETPNIQNTTILSQESFEFRKRTFVKYVLDTKKEKDKERFYCLDNDIPFYLATAKGYGYRTLKAFFNCLWFYESSKPTRKEMKSSSLATLEPYLSYECHL